MPNPVKADMIGAVAVLVGKVAPRKNLTLMDSERKHDDPGSQVSGEFSRKVY